MKFLYRQMVFGDFTPSDHKIDTMTKARKSHFDYLNSKIKLYDQN